MVDDSELTGLDPYDLLDQEAARLDAFFSGLAPRDWERSTRCAGWTVRDLLAHLAATEAYHHACLDGTVGVLMSRMAAQGATDLDSANAAGVAGFSDVPTPELLDRWERADADTRRRYRERGDATVDTSVGEYRARWQAFHVALELATHADDLGAPVGPDERSARREWMARVSRFALAEAKPDARVSTRDGLTRVQVGAVDVELDDGEIIAAVGNRLDPASGFDAATRAALTTLP